MTGFEFTKGTSVGMMNCGALLTEMGQGGKKNKKAWLRWDWSGQWARGKARVVGSVVGVTIMED